MRPRGLRFLPLLLSLLAPVLILCGVWWPDFAHYYIPTPSIPVHAVDTARGTPDDSLLQELAGFTSIPGFPPDFSSDRDLTAAADKLLQGEVDIRGLPRTRVTVPFSAEDIDKGRGSWQLSLASLILPDILLRAYRHTHDDRYLLAARDMILGWAGYERRAWLPGGFLWNDHAMAARIPVLAAFWLAYRHHPAYDAAVAHTLLENVARSGYVLANPAHFTFSTNHGVMQNLALFHLSLAFPSLPDAARYRDTALARLRQQMTFYINTEGVVLEHSAGYHKVGLDLLGLALRYLTLMQITPPDDWPEKYRRASLFYAQLRLPDGSLPLIGDTANRPDPPSPPAGRIGPGWRAAALRSESAWRPTEPHSLYPVAGYSIWWDGLDHWPQPSHLSQTVVTWSHFPGHGHKHADEMSVSLWAGGQMWWSNVGYWPYDLRGRSQVESWSGSNAPHLVTESAKSQRSTRLVSAGWSRGLAAVHLERRGPAQYSARRQVVHLGSNIWVVVDHASGAAQDLTRTVWTTSPNIRLAPDQAPDSYSLRPADSPLAMSVRVLTSSGTTVKQVQGSFEPFAGWQVVDSTSAPAPAPALVIDQPGRDSWTIVVSCLNIDSPDAVPCPDRIEGHFSRDEDWVVALETRSARLALRRATDTIQVDGDLAPRRSQTLALRAPADVSPAIEDLRRAYVQAASQYPRFKDVTRYRVRVSVAIVLLVTAQEVLFAVPTRLKRRSHLFRALATLAWALLGTWLIAVYFP